MKRTLYLIFMAIFISGVYASNYRSIVPNDFSKMIRLEYDKFEIDYYFVSKEKPIRIMIEGPRLLKVYFRGISDTSFPQKDVSFIYSEDNDIRNVSMTLKADNSEKSNRFISEYGEIRVKIDEGKHELVFWTNEDFSNNIILRFRTLKEQENVKKIHMNPINNPQIVQLVYQEEILNYYRITESKGTELILKGPTTLDIINRLEFDYFDRGKQSYNVIVLEDGEEKHTFSLIAKVSEITTYKESTDKKVSKWKKLSIQIPRGVHKYEFFSGNKSKSILQRYKIPKDAVLKK